VIGGLDARLVEDVKLGISNVELRIHTSNS